MQKTLLTIPPPLSIEEAIAIIDHNIGVNLRTLSDHFVITQPNVIPKQKGWAGLTVERLLGLAPNSSQSADFETWELKLCSLIKKKSGILDIKDPMALTMLKPKTLHDVAFENSHLADKTKMILVVCRLYQDHSELDTPLLGYAQYIPSAEEITRVRQEYEHAQWLIQSQGITGLKEFTGELLALRPYQDGYWRWYAQRLWVRQMLSTFQGANTAR